MLHLQEHAFAVEEVEEEPADGVVGCLGEECDEMDVKKGRKGEAEVAFLGKNVVKRGIIVYLSMANVGLLPDFL